MYRLLTLLVPAALLVPATGQAQVALTESHLEAFHPRVIGPAVTGGRVHDVESVPEDPDMLWVATASGGLWKSENRGQTWVNTFADMPVSTFGDVALAPSNPDIVYAGTGEENNRQSTSYGNGIYRSDDGGETWTHLGLENTRHIGEVLVHPTDPDVAYVAAQGNLWASSEDRGVYRTTDGGASWEKVLFIDEHTGVVDLDWNQSNPDEIYAATYQRLRRSWGFNGGGPGSGIYKSTDGGDSWTELTNGIPGEDKGRIGIAVAQSNPRVLNALIEYADDDLNGTYRSEDAGASWERVSDLNIRPMYYSHIWIDPSDEDRVYSLATRSNRSDDGGRTWTDIARRVTYDVGVHSDHHALWINPGNPDHLIMGGDAGLHVSYDRGHNFRKINNFPITQMYAIAVDMQDPYWVYTGLQDNHSFMGPSETRRWIGIVNDDWMQNGFGDGMYWQADPRPGSPYRYGSSQNGNYFRYDFATGDMLDISPHEGFGEEEYRFDWASPMLLSEHDPDRLVVAGNRVFVSTDNGESWTRTEDLSRQIDRDTLTLMGVRGGDMSISPNDGTSSFGEAVTLAESPIAPEVFWVGFDDGNLQVTRNNGGSWTEVSGSVPGIEDGTYVSRITASTRSLGTAYAAFDAHRRGDFQPYLFRTTDFGASWTPIHAGLPEMGPVNDVIEHPDNPDVLFVGTEHAVFASVDAGSSWTKMANLPTTLYDDLLIHPREKDLVMGTHGQGVWILDDTRPLVEWGNADGMVHLFSIGLATIKNYRKDTSYRAQAEFHGVNPPDGALVTYRLGAGSGSAVLRVARVDGEVIRRMTVPSSAGLHRVNWDLRHPLEMDDDVWERWDDPEIPRPIDDRGPWVSPGTYTLTLEARGGTSTQTVEVRGDPKLALTLAQYQTRERFMLKLLAMDDAFEALMESRGMTGSGEDGPDDARIREASNAVGGIFGDLNGGGVRGGSLHPPTTSMLERARAAEAVLEEFGGGSGRR
ncbi:MAG: hypothetical protein WD101_05880 [Gemmatimonadota bacterium]